MRLLQDDRYDFNAVAAGEEDLEMFFHRVNNAFVHQMALSLRQEDVHHLCNLRAKESDLQCQIRALCIRCLPAEIDYGLVDFLGVSLTPQRYGTSMNGELHEDQVMLFAHEALRRSVMHLEYWASTFPHNGSG